MSRLEVRGKNMTMFHLVNRLSLAMKNCNYFPILHFQRTPPPGRTPSGIEIFFAKLRTTEAIRHRLKTHVLLLLLGYRRPTQSLVLRQDVTENVHVDCPLNTSHGSTNRTRSSAIAEGPRDALC